MLHEIMQVYDTLGQKFKVLSIINEIRSASSAHVPSESRLRTALKELGFAPEEENWLRVYRKIVEDVLDLFTYICFEF